jgi:hypothetical protein
MENQNEETKILGMSKLAISSFIAGTGIIMWMISVVFSPINGLKTDIALIQQSISNINTNHEVHIQDLTQGIKDIKVEQVNQESQIIELQKQLITILSKK